MPKSYFLYRQFDQAGALLYVGVSSRPSIRLTQHRRSLWYRSIARVETVEFGSMEGALAAERLAIEREGPIWNVQHNAPERVVPREAPSVIDLGRCFQVGNLTISKNPGSARMWRIVADMLRQRHLLPELRDVAPEDLPQHLQAAAVPLATTIIPKVRPLTVARAALPG